MLHFMPAEIIAIIPSFIQHLKKRSKKFLLDFFNSEVAA